MKKRRWLEAVKKAADQDNTELPWARGARRASRKAAAKSRAIAA